MKHFCRIIIQNCTLNSVGINLLKLESNGSNSLHTCRIKKLGRAVSISINPALIHHARLLYIRMAWVSRVSPWCSNYQPEKLN
jgi:hypothetical protein